MWQLAWCQTCWRPGGRASQQPVWSSAARLTRLVKGADSRALISWLCPGMEGGNEGTWGKVSHLIPGRKVKESLCVADRVWNKYSTCNCWRWETLFFLETHPKHELKSLKIFNLSLNMISVAKHGFLDWVISSCRTHLCKSLWELVAVSRSQCKEFLQVTPSLHGAVWGRF